MSGMRLQSGIIYGPIHSRRLYRSLGINLMPTNRKVCSFDCIYCQYGKTTEHTLSPSRKDLPTVQEVLEEVERVLKKPRTIDYLTFSGNGEPTLHPDFIEIVQGVHHLKNRLRTDAKLAILSNSSCVSNPEVLEALGLMDAAMMKLDAGEQSTFQAINQPVKNLEFSSIIEGLKSIPQLILQCVLIDGEISNIRDDADEAWASALKSVDPKMVHIYSTERPTYQGRVKCVSPQQLEIIAKDLSDRFGLKVEAFWRE